MRKNKIKEYIPIDKSHCIRMIFLDLLRLNKNTCAEKFLNLYPSSDLESLANSVSDWLNGFPIRVGESGTLYRFFQFAAWKLKQKKEFILSGTLKNRNITKDSSIINLSQKKLLSLDNQTSQWASASALFGDKERIKNPPLKLALTYNCIDSWSPNWKPIIDTTIMRQAESIWKTLKTRKIDFVPEHSEDFCLAYFFGKITLEDAVKRWPSLQSHETNRIKEADKVWEELHSTMSISSKDHRIVQAAVLWLRYFNIPLKEIKIKYPHCVEKSWPLFWGFVNNL